MDQNESDAGSKRQLVPAPGRGFYAASVDVPAPTSIDDILNPDGSAKPPWVDLFPVFAVGDES